MLRKKHAVVRGRHKLEMHQNFRKAQIKNISSKSRTRQQNISSSINWQGLLLLMIIGSAYAVDAYGSNANAHKAQNKKNKQNNENNPSKASPKQFKVEARNETKHDTSPPLRELISSSSYIHSLHQKHNETPSLPHIVSKSSKLRTSSQFDSLKKSFLEDSLPVKFGVSFQGIGIGLGNYVPSYSPPDTNGAAGNTQYVQIVNTDLAVFDKDNGSTILGPLPIVNLWRGFNQSCEEDYISDPVVLFDKIDQRWFISNLAGRSARRSLCVAISTSPDACGSYYRYAFPIKKLDYQKFGVWPDGYYMTNNGSPDVCVLEREKMIAGSSAIMQCAELGWYDTTYRFITHLPADFDGAPPPYGTPNYFAGLNFYRFDGEDDFNNMYFYQFHVNWNDSRTSRFIGPLTVPIASFKPFEDGIQQPDTKQTLDSLSKTIMYRLAYRHNNGTAAIVINHTVATDDGKAGIRWYEFKIFQDREISLIQQNTFSPDNSYHRWMGSMAMDGIGNIALGYSISNAENLFPSIAITGRTIQDQLGMLRNEKIIVSGGSSQLDDDRWGDYSSMSVDPADDCTFWYTNEYIKTHANDSLWSTYVSSFKFPDCSTTQRSDNKFLFFQKESERSEKKDYQNRQVAPHR